MPANGAEPSADQGRRTSRRLPPTHQQQATAMEQHAGAMAGQPMHGQDPYSPPLLPPVGNRFVPPPAVPAEPADFHALAAAEPLHAPTLDLTTLESFACANNPTLVQARAHTQAALGMAIQAGLWPNPRVAMVGDEMGQDGTAGEFIGGTMRQEIVTAHKQQLSRAKYLARTRVAEWVAIEQQFRVLNDVRAHYFHTLGQQQIVQIQRELVRTAEDELLTRREQYNVGQANAAEVHRANVALQRQRLELLMAENQWRAWWQSMTALAGVELPFGTLTGNLDQDLPTIEWSHALQRLLVESPQMQAAQAKLEADHVQLQRELVQSVPNIAVTTGAGRDYTSRPGRAVGFAQLAMDLPVWNRNEGTVREARSDLARQQAELRRVALHLRQQLAETYAHYLTSLQYVQNYREVMLPEAQKAYALELDSYGQDRIRWPDVLRSQREYFQLRLEYVEHLVKLRDAEVQIVGYLLRDGLDAPPNPVPPGHINVNPQPR